MWLQTQQQNSNKNTRCICCKIKLVMLAKTIMQAVLREINGYTYRLAQHMDLISIMEINLKTLPEHYSDYFYESLLDEIPEAFVVSLHGDKYVGYIMCKTEYGFSCFRRLGFVKKGHVVSVAVLPEYRRQGIGRTLVEEAVKGIRSKQCVEMYLEVRCSNIAAVQLYESMGFMIKQQLRSYYRDGEDAFLMTIEFSKQ